MVTNLIKLSAFIMVSSLFLSSCGGGGGSDAPLSITTPPLTTSTITLNQIAPSTITGEATAFLFADIPDFSGAIRRAIAVDVATGQINVFDDDDAINRFLNKQPNPQDSRLFSSDSTDVVGLSHLSHQLGQGDSASLGTQLSLDGINQLDPGHFFLFGKAGQMAQSPQRYEMNTRYFCSHCRTNFGTATGSLSFENAQQQLTLTLSNDEIALILPYRVTGADALHQLTLQAEGASFIKDGAAQPITQATGTGHFLGEGARDVGVLYSLHQEEGLITGGAIGKAP